MVSSSSSERPFYFIDRSIDKEDSSLSRSPCSSLSSPYCDSSSSSDSDSTSTPPSQKEVKPCEKDCKYCSCHAPPLPTPVEDNKESSNASDVQDQEREIQRKVLASRLELEEELQASFRAICVKAAEVEAYSRYPSSDHHTDMVQNDVRRSIKLEIRKHEQAGWAAIISRNTAWRLLGDNNSWTKGVLKSSRNSKPKTDYGKERISLKLSKNLLDFVKTDTKDVPVNKKSKTEDGCGKRLKMDKIPMIAQLTGVTIFPKVEGQGKQSISGTLEAHFDRFEYKISTSCFRSKLTCEYENVNEAFVQGCDDELPDDKKMLPLLHLKLHQPITVGTERTYHIQFRLVGERRSEDCGKDLHNFVIKVATSLSESKPLFPFNWISEQKKFRGKICQKEIDKVFVLTFSSLLQLTSKPFCAISFPDIEIINLARIRPGEFDMTVVSQNFNSPVLQIKSIPLDFLEDIKQFFDRWWGVKYYDNNLDLDWDSIVKRIALRPQAFIQEGGWNAYKLEDTATSLYYGHYYLKLYQDGMMEKKDRIQG